MAANQVGAGRVFDQDENALEVFWADGHERLAQASKADIARALAQIIARQYAARGGGHSSTVPLRQAQP